MILTLTYDLNKEKTSADYKPLIDELQRLGAHRYQASAWLANLNNTAPEVHDHFKRLMDSNDSLWVSEFTGLHYYSGARSGTNPVAECKPSRSLTGFGRRLMPPTYPCPPPDDGSNCRSLRRQHRQQLRASLSPPCAELGSSPDRLGARINTETEPAAVTGVAA